MHTEYACSAAPPSPLSLPSHFIAQSEPGPTQDKAAPTIAQAYCAGAEVWLLFWRGGKDPAILRRETCVGEFVALRPVL